jgi:hypothetical protein
MAFIEQKLNQVITNLGTVSDILTSMKECITGADKPFTVDEYFNFLLVLERVHESRDRLETIIQRRQQGNPKNEA